MPIGQPRRIFRSGFAQLGARALTAVLLMMAVGGAVWVAMWLRQTSSPGLQAAQTPQEVVAQPAQVAVVDGGTLRLSDHVIRLSGVRPPSRGTVCGAGGQSAVDCGAAATNALAALVRDVPVACRVTGQDDSGNAYGVCQASGTEINRAVIAAGWARAEHGSVALRDAESAARAEHRGVWASEHSW